MITQAWLGMSVLSNAFSLFKKFPMKTLLTKQDLSASFREDV